MTCIKYKHRLRTFIIPPSFHTGSLRYLGAKDCMLSSKGSFTYYVSQEGEGGGFQMLTIAYGGRGGRGLAYVSKKITILGVKKNKIRVKTDEHHDY